METTSTTTTAQPAYPIDVVMIDDEEMFTEGCRQTLEMGGYRAAVARNGMQGLDLVSGPSQRRAGRSEDAGHEWSGSARPFGGDRASPVPIIVTGHGTVDSAVESMKVGAFDFLTKPFDPEKLLESVRRGMSLSVLRQAAKEPAKAAGSRNCRASQQERCRARGAGCFERSLLSRTQQARVS